jgi:hypothetical protein
MLYSTKLKVHNARNTNVFILLELHRVILIMFQQLNRATHFRKADCDIYRCLGDGKGKAVPAQAWKGPKGSRWSRLPEFIDNRNMKVVRLSLLRSGRLYPSRKIPGAHFSKRLSRPQGHSATGRIMSMEDSNDPIGNQTRDHSAYKSRKDWHKITGS